MVEQEDSLDVERLIRDTEQQMLNPASSLSPAAGSGSTPVPSPGVSSSAAESSARSQLAKVAFGGSRSSLHSVSSEASGPTGRNPSQIAPSYVHDSPARGPHAISAPSDSGLPSPTPTTAPLHKLASCMHQIDMEQAARLLATASKAREQRIRGGISRRSHSDEDDDTTGNSCGNVLRARQRRIKALVLDGKAFGETDRLVRSIFVFMLYASTVSCLQNSKQKTHPSSGTHPSALALFAVLHHV